MPPRRRLWRVKRIRPMENHNNAETAAPRASGVRHSILDLAPLELECLSALWPMGEATVRDIHRALAESRPRAYTTVMTIMDRLAQKGIVSRRKAGRAFLYQAKLTAEEARLKAVEKIVDGFFDGSREALAAHLSRLSVAFPADGGATRAGVTPPTPAVDSSAARIAESQNQNLDETLL